MARKKYYGACDEENLMERVRETGQVRYQINSGDGVDRRFRPSVKWR